MDIGQRHQTDKQEMDSIYCIEIASADGKPIEMDIWGRLIDSDPELLRVTETQGVNPMTGEPMTVPYNAPTAAWLNHPEGYTKPPFVFAYEKGIITALSVDRHFVRKGEEIATRLDATISVSGGNPE